MNKITTFLSYYETANLYVLPISGFVLIGLPPHGKAMRVVTP